MKYRLLTTDLNIFKKFNEFKHKNKVVFDKSNINLISLNKILNNVNKGGKINIKVFEEGDKIIFQKVNPYFDFNLYHK